jgi:hypothetical protein
MLGAVISIAGPAWAQEAGIGSAGQPVAIAPVVVATPRLEKYTVGLRGSKLWLLSVDDPRGRPPGSPAPTDIGDMHVIGIAGARVGEQIVSIEGRDVGTFTHAGWTEALFYARQPVHLVLRSRSGQVHAVESFNE